MLFAMHVLADGGISNTQVAALLGVGVLIYTIMRWRKLNVFKRGKEPEETRSIYVPQKNPLSMREVTAEVEALLAELEETSRRMTAQLENRYIKLEQLMAEADEKIRR